MILSENPRIDLTYCLNVHPGQSWADQCRAIEEASLRIKESVSPEKPFGLGLRVANFASEELESAEAQEEAARFLEERDCYAFTINGFPFDHFHGTAVKEKVYSPDWQSESRWMYTCRLAELLATMLPEGATGSISTVPGSYKAWIQKESQIAAMVSNLIETVLFLDGIRERKGQEIHLGLEPEPDCYLETTEETIRFFEDELLPAGIRIIAAEKRISRSAAEAIVRKHLGVCFDTCHLALQFEDLADSWKRFVAAGIRISKVQLSNALKVDPTPESLERLKEFVEPVYLHQVKARTEGGEIVGWLDLPVALKELAESGNRFKELRVHFHVPLFFAGAGVLETTQASLTPEFWDLLRGGDCAHLEIETYTYDVLPETVRPKTLVESVTQEYQWVLERWQQPM